MDNFLLLSSAYSDTGIAKYIHVFVGVFPDDVNVPFGFQVYVKDHDCNDHIEKLYYSYGYETCCIHCGEYVHGNEDDDCFYPQCDECQENPISKSTLTYIF